MPFFGKPACTNLTFAKLAARSGAAVIPGFAVWSRAERKYILRFYPEVPITGDAAGGHGADSGRHRSRHPRISRPVALDTPPLEDPPARRARLVRLS